MQPGSEDELCNKRNTINPMYIISYFKTSIGTHLAPRLDCLLLEGATSSSAEITSCLASQTESSRSNTPAPFRLCTEFLRCRCTSRSPHCASAHGALHAVKPTQLGQFPAPPLQLIYAGLQVVGELTELFDSSNVLHEDALLQGWTKVQSCS